MASDASTVSPLGHSEFAASLSACGCTQCQAAAVLVAPGAGSPLQPVSAFATGNNSIDALLAGDSFRWNYNAAVGTGVTLTYSFMSSLPSYYGAAREANGFAATNAAQRTAIQSALALYAEVANITFNFAANGSGMLQFGQTLMSPGVAAYAYYAYNPSYDQRGGDVWLGSNVSANANPTVGSYGFLTVVHEIGHALGLKHPGNYNAGGGGTTGPYLPSATDNVKYTVMSYYGGSGGANNPQTLMLYDIMAIQYLYGVNTSTRSGNSTYSWSLNQNFVQTIWDGGGTDTIDASNQTRRSIINLNAGTFSSIGANGASNATDNLAIAYNVVIENAFGGAGNDLITGNAANNVLEGNAGADVLTGGNGDDTLNGGTGNDSLSGGAGTDTAVFSGSQGTYTITQNGLITTVVGPDGTDVLEGVEFLQFTGSGTVAAPQSLPTPDGDIDGDGRSDLLLHNGQSGQILVWSMNGANAIQGRSVTFNNTVVNVASPWRIEGVADFDGDGRTDAIWRNGNTGQLSMWLLNGATIASQSGLTNNGAVLSLPSNWRVEATADFDGDGKGDILSRNTANGQLAFWAMNGTTLGGGTGMVTSNGMTTSLPMGFQVEVAADFTGDGKADLLVRNSGNGAIYLWAMDGSTLVSGANTGAITIGGTAQFLPTASFRVEGAADYTGDGKADLILHNTVSGNVYLWEMDGRTVVSGSNTGMVQRSQTINSTIGGGLATKIAADSTGDGNGDILLHQQATGNLYLWQMNGATRTSGAQLQAGGSNVALPAGARVEAMADFDGDGKSDILWRNTVNGRMSVWQLDGSTVVAGAVTGPVTNGGSSLDLPSAWQVLGAADLTGDGKADILARNTNNGTLFLWQMDGRSVVSGANTGTVMSGALPGTLASASWNIEGVADFSGDGNADILIRNRGTGALFVWAMNGRNTVAGGNTGAVLQNGAALSLPLAWQIESTADFSGDGKADMLFRNQNNGQLAMWVMNGVSAVGSMVQLNGTTATVPLSWTMAGSADLDGDDKADIVWRNPANGQTSTWKMDGATVTSFASISYNESNAIMSAQNSVAGTNDYDGDGHADILWRDSASGQLSLWTMNGLNAVSDDIVQMNSQAATFSSSWRALA